MLHVCGFNDRNSADFDRMYWKEDQILKFIVFDAVFHPAALPQPHRNKKGQK